MQRVTISLPGENDYLTEEAYRTLRTNLQFCGRDKKVIAFTSCMENEGKSTVALHVAKSFAQLNKKVLLIDADMRKSVLVGRNTDAHDMKGLSELLTGIEQLSNCICATQYKGLSIVFAGTYPPNPVELLNGQYFEVFISKMRELFDYIIIDTPPLGIVVDAAVITVQCDGAVLVMGDRKINAQMAMDVADQIERSGCKLLGVVKNNTRSGIGGYGYRYSRYGKYGRYDKYSRYGGKGYYGKKEQ